MSINRVSVKRVLVVLLTVALAVLSTIVPSLAVAPGDHVHIYRTATGSTCAVPMNPSVTPGTTVTVNLCAHAGMTEVGAPMQPVQWTVSDVTIEAPPELTTDAGGEASIMVKRTDAGTGTVQGTWTSADGGPQSAMITVTWAGPPAAELHLHLLTAVGDTTTPEPFPCHTDAEAPEVGTATAAGSANADVTTTQTLHACVHDESHAPVASQPVELVTANHGSAAAPVSLGPTATNAFGVASFPYTSATAGRTISHATTPTADPSIDHNVTWKRPLDHVHLYVEGQGSCESHPDPATVLVGVPATVVACVQGAGHDGVPDSRSTPPTGGTGTGAQVNVTWGQSPVGQIEPVPESRTDVNGQARATVLSDSAGPGNVSLTAFGSNSKSGDLDINYICPPLTAASTSYFPFDMGFSGGIYVTAGDLNGDGCDEVIAGAGPGGGPHVRVFRGDGLLIAQTFAYDVGFKGGVRVATADVDGDGIDELVTGPGKGGGPHVKVFGLAGTTLTEESSFFAFDPGFTGGVFPAGGNFLPDPAIGDEIAIGAGEGGGPHVKIMDETGAALNQFFPFALAFNGGVRVAASNIQTADAEEELITAAGPGGGPHVLAWDVTTSAFAQRLSFFAYSLGFSGGVYVGGGQAVTGSTEEIVTGAGEGGGPHVRVWSSAATELASFFPYDSGSIHGVRVAVSLVDEDGDGEVVTGPGPGGGPHLRVIE